MRRGNETFKITFTATKDNPKPPVITDGTKHSDPGNDKDFVTLVTAECNDQFFDLEEIFLQLTM
ncbi:MAG: hypothetical protein IPG79_01970 [Saprospiraceae bacterium]|nr:hypothetical protein [Saprospiraceae bacterium]